MRSQKVLITGGAGFIGSNLANYLVDDNEVIVIDDEYLGDPANLREEVDYRKLSVLDEGLPTDVDVVFHLAALSSLMMHEEGVSSLRRGLRVNVEGFANVVEQARQDGCETVVYATTSSIYGSRHNPSHEREDVKASTGYEASKLARERYAEYFSNAYGMSMAGMRFFSVYQGYGGSEEHKGEYANIISQFANWIANDEQPVVYGDGTHSRDFTHVSDVVKALEAAADNELNGIYNVGTGEQYTANEIISMLCDELDSDVEPKYVENPIPEEMFVEHTKASNRLMEVFADWEPEISLEEGVKQVCEPYK